MRKYLAFDTETALISAEDPTPALSCVSWFDGEESGLIHWSTSLPWLREALISVTKQAPLVGHNIVFDLAVVSNEFPELLPLVFSALDRDAIRDTLIREKLINIAGGVAKYHKYSLKVLIKKYFDQDLDKDEWRLGYGELRDVPLEEWPEGAKIYPVKDAIVTGKLFEAQDDNPFGQEVFEDESRQNRANFALFLMSAHGIITDPKAVDSLETKTLAEIAGLKQELVAKGLVREEGSRNSKAVEERLYEELGEEAERTPTGRIKTNQAACEASGNPDLISLARYRQLQTLLTKDVTALRQGTRHPIHTRFDALLDTGRTSSSKPNLQNPRREPGVRECFVPRPGFYFVSVDYDSAELHTLSQITYTLFDYSAMRDRLNENRDLHLDFASQMMGISYEEAKARKNEPEMKQMRQRAKVANLGFYGGMGAKKLALYAEGYGVNLTERECYELRNHWLESYPEMKEYFRWINSQLVDNKANISHLYSNRLRGGASYTEACNSFVQGLAADLAKEAVYEVVKKSYTDKESPLFGSRAVLFIHDELIIEAPIARAEEAAKELERVMLVAFNKWCPDVHGKASAVMMKYWSKDAKRIEDENGHLLPWG
jgi:DNA polymerase I-like protein with 3'-5' exonuclease and polymerase domains